MYIGYISHIYIREIYLSCRPCSYLTVYQREACDRLMVPANHTLQRQDCHGVSRAFLAAAPELCCGIVHRCLLSPVSLVMFLNVDSEVIFTPRALRS